MAQGTEHSRKSAVFLDRDGVLIHATVRDSVPHPPASVDQVQIIDAAPAALNELRRAGHLLIVVTNQPDVARGAQTREGVDQINRLLMARLPLDQIYVCCHDTADHCACRKPAPGLLSDAARQWGIDLAASFMVGDRWSDVEAGRAAGCTTILLDRDYSRRERCTPNHVVADLTEAARLILAYGK